MAQAATAADSGTRTLRTPVCDLLEIDYPVMQAGMGIVADGTLAGHVSKAGGLGVIGAAQMTADELAVEIAKARAITGNPFGVDILFGKPKATGAGADRYEDNIERQIEVALDAAVPVIVSGLGNPAAVIGRAHDKGIKVMSVVGTVKQAQQVTAAGVDAVIASGCDGGGHVGTIGTAVLVPAAVDAVDVPVIAGGGLVDGRGLVAALAWGAQAVWMGTRFIATHQANVHANYSGKIAEIGTDGTIVTRCHSGKTCRLIRNDFTESWEGREAEIKPFPLQLQEFGGPASVLGRLEGDTDNGSLPAGQGSGLIREVVDAGQVVAEVMAEARAVLDRLAAF